MKWVEVIEPWVNRLGELPALILLLAAIPLLIIAWAKRIYPDRMLLYLFAVPCFLTGLLLVPQSSLPQALAALFKRDSLALIVAIDLAVVAIVTWDLFSLPSRRMFSTERECQRIASLQQYHPVTVSVDNRSSREYQVWIRDDMPNEFEVMPDEIYINVPPMSRCSVTYQFTPQNIATNLFSLPKWAWIVAALSKLSLRGDCQRLSGHASIVQVRRIGQNESVELDGCAQDSANWSRQ